VKGKKRKKSRKEKQDSCPPAGRAKQDSAVNKGNNPAEAK